MGDGPWRFRLTASDAAANTAAAEWVVTLDLTAPAAAPSREHRLPVGRLGPHAGEFRLDQGHDLLAEENEAVSVTWYTPDDITTLLLDAGYRDAIVGESPREGGDNQTFSVTALA